MSLKRATGAPLAVANKCEAVRGRERGWRWGGGACRGPHGGEMGMISGDLAPGRTAMDDVTSPEAGVLAALRS